MVRRTRHWLEIIEEISIQAIAAKVSSNELKRRLQKWAESTLSEMQYGFRLLRSCADAKFALRCVMAPSCERVKVFFSFVSLTSGRLIAL